MNKLRRPIDASDHVRGRKDARVTLVEYGDYACARSGEAASVVQKTLRRFSSDVRFAYRHFPRVHEHEHALDAAQAAEAAGAQGRFWPMHAMLFDNPSSLDAGGLRRLAARVGLDVGRFEAEVRSGVHLSKVKSDFRSGIDSGVRSTPSFFIDGIAFDGDWRAPDDLANALGDASNRAGVRAGSPDSGAA